MRKLIAAFLLAGTAVAGPAIAADLVPYYPPVIDVPDVDYGVAGGLYLRGSVAGNAWWAKDAASYCGCVPAFDKMGYGYSVGAGFGYDSGHGVRADITLDYLSNEGLKGGDHTVNLRSGLALANLYYDFNLSGNGYGAGGFGAYVGAGIGVAKNYTEVNGPGYYAYGHSLEAAAAVMAGVSYDFGSYVADVGYRGIYMNKVMNQPANIQNAYLINDNFINEIRTSLRYRF
ncbi:MULTISPECIES: hypothetical protein [unclassified Devosia]|uniref:outer membrane protein n=1 Tax=unclassified Devosia TaxID=196773 RepID=UPI000715029D|nr:MULTISPECIES: hypothetical protein [unclassified Devosia]KQN77310.1 hypothetical protein ASE94_17605 [Devosia sp. Leaf64]KQT47081.1 hypothetical protein ASG47_10845 [Devosia sp. Leaf420]